MKIRFYVLALTLLCSQIAWGKCNILTSSNHPAPIMDDGLNRILNAENNCPADVFAFRQLLKNTALKFETTMVANRGFHNPAQGSFSIFEMITGKLNDEFTIHPGEFFFGHFTAINAQGYLIADQTHNKNSLMIEAIAWDHKKQIYNFYELRGTGKSSQWFYSGDSLDILADNQLLHRQTDPEHPQFGNRLRCSGCHGAGGPIMKELYLPHNDWWEIKRKLDFGGHAPDVALNEIISTLTSAETLAKNTLTGINTLHNSNYFKNKKSLMSLQEQLRPLFCPVEINFMSDELTNEQQNNVAIPAEFFVDPRLLNDKTSLQISRRYYEEALKTLGSHFPETSLLDGDHAWLTPVKAASDMIAVRKLIENKVIDNKFVMDVLAIDMPNPVFSPSRCQLLKFIPNKKTPNWLDQFKKNLADSQNDAAKKLLANMSDPNKTRDFYRLEAQKFLQQCARKLNNVNQVTKLYGLLAQRRVEIKASEISANPLGQILEPGFRVIFPENNLPAKANKLQLDLSCEVK